MPLVVCGKPNWFSINTFIVAYFFDNATKHASKNYMKTKRRPRSPDCRTQSPDPNLSLYSPDFTVMQTKPECRFSWTWQPNPEDLPLFHSLMLATVAKHPVISQEAVLQHSQLMLG